MGEKKRYKNKESVAPFLEAYFKLDDDTYLEEIIHQLFLFLIAGEDTTGALIEVSLALLAIHPEYQDKILSDVKQNGIHTSKVLNNFINEANRNTDPVPEGAPRTVIEPFTIHGYNFEAGTNVIFQYSSTMISEKYWENADNFNPERFNKPIDHPNAYTPFSSGPRNCIGQHMALMEIRIALVRILEKYRITKRGTEYKTAYNGVVCPLTDKHFIGFEVK